jgi:hypothetical protein
MRSSETLPPTGDERSEAGGLEAIHVVLPWGDSYPIHAVAAWTSTVRDRRGGMAQAPATSAAAAALRRSWRLFSW